MAKEMKSWIWLGQTCSCSYILSCSFMLTTTIEKLFQLTIPYRAVALFQAELLLLINPLIQELVLCDFVIVIFWNPEFFLNLIRYFLLTHFWRDAVLLSLECNLYCNMNSNISHVLYWW